jgi:hypothetical protein
MGIFFCVHSTHEKFVVGLALVGVSLGELNDSFIETVTLTDIAAQPGCVSAFGMGTRERPATHPGEIVEHRSFEMFERNGSLHIPELTYVKVMAIVIAGPSQEYVAGTLHQALSNDDAFAFVRESVPLTIALMH